MPTLELRYWQEENGDNCSAWRLARKDNQPVKFPKTFDLTRLFRQLVPQDRRGLRVMYGGNTFRMIRMSTGLPRHYRESFLAQLESRVKLL